MVLKSYEKKSEATGEQRFRAHLIPRQDQTKGVSRHLLYVSLFSSTIASSSGHLSAIRF